MNEILFAFLPQGRITLKMNTLTHIEQLLWVLGDTTVKQTGFFYV